jgi:hypothetical protein
MFRCHRRSQRLEKLQGAMGDVIMAEEEVFVEEKERLP